MSDRDIRNMLPSPEGVGLRVLSPGMRILLIVAGGLVFLAGLQLFVFTERTDELFAWTIDVPLTAAFLGAGYWASVAYEWLAAREHLWANARIAVPSVFLFTSLTLVATLLHLELFHLDSNFDLITRAVTWGWLVIYVSVPMFMVVTFVKQMRLPGSDPERVAPLPKVIAVILVVHAVLFVAFGAWLFAAPERALSLWPWPLTPLTGRAVGAWLMGLGVAAAHSRWENDARRVRAAAAGYVVIAILQGIALARYPDAVVWGEPQAAVYLVALVSMIVVGIALLGRSRDSERKKTPRN